MNSFKTHYASNFHNKITTLVKQRLAVPIKAARHATGLPPRPSTLGHWVETPSRPWRVARSFGTMIFLWCQLSITQPILSCSEQRDTPLSPLPAGLHQAARGPVPPLAAEINVTLDQVQGAPWKERQWQCPRHPVQNSEGPPPPPPTPRLHTAPSAWTTQPSLSRTDFSCRQRGRTLSRAPGDPAPSVDLC